MSDLYERMKELVETQNVEGISLEIKRIYSHNDGETIVVNLLGWEEVHAELLDEALEAFLATRENRRREHGFWVHSLSHFTSSLWQRKMYNWIRRFNEVAFKGAIELGDSNCSDRLVGDFCDAHWSLDPKDFGLTIENLSWMDRKYQAQTMERIEHGPFECEADFIEWQLDRPELPKNFDYEAQRSLIAVKQIREQVQRLRELVVTPAASKPC